MPSLQAAGSLLLPFLRRLLLTQLALTWLPQLHGRVTKASFPVLLWGVRREGKREQHVGEQRESPMTPLKLTMFYSRYELLSALIQGEAIFTLRSLCSGVKRKGYSKEIGGIRGKEY